VTDEEIAAIEVSLRLACPCCPEEAVRDLIAEVRRLRAPAKWSKEPPTEPGFYWAFGMGHPPRAEPVEVVVHHSGKLVMNILGWDDGGGAMEAYLWGPRLEAPPLPSEEKVDDET
jgi:hypothetical protein